MTIEGHRSHIGELISVDAPPRHEYGGIRPQKTLTEKVADLLTS